MEPDRNNNKNINNNNNNNNNNNDNDKAAESCCDKSSHLEECELVEKFCSKAGRPVPREVSQLVVVVARMARVVGKEEVELLMEAYNSDLKEIQYELANIRNTIEDTNDFINIHLNSIRNRIIKMSLFMEVI